ncbi:MAG TPA: hypothetical protein VNS32_10100 [Flavisolibacter sp.]|nr:hypothetical protein [Flavisolibacter sp.]
MKKVIKSRWFILAALLVISISALSFVAYKKAHVISLSPNNCCQNLQMNSSSEMLWDILSRQFVSSVSNR